MDVATNDLPFLELIVIIAPRATIPFFPIHPYAKCLHGCYIVRYNYCNEACHRTEILLSDNRPAIIVTIVKVDLTYWYNGDSGSQRAPLWQEYGYYSPNGRVFYFPVKRHVCYSNRWHVKLREDGREKVKLFGLKFWKIFISRTKNLSLIIIRTIPNYALSRRRKLYCENSLILKLSLYLK